MSIAFSNALLGLTDTHIHYIDERIGIHHEMLSAWQALQQAAASDGFELTIASGFRDFERQRVIWNNKFLGNTVVLDKDEQTVDCEALPLLDKIKAIMLFSALPGASRHHWGTDIDVYAPNLLPRDHQLQLSVGEYEQGGPMEALNIWLTNHIDEFNFYRPYDQYRNGVYKEPWHLSYHPLATQFEQQFSMKALVTQLENAHIEGKNIIIEHMYELYQQFIINIARYQRG